MKSILSTIGTKVKVSKGLGKKSANIIHEHKRFHELITLERERVHRNELQFSLILMRIDEKDPTNKSKMMQMVQNVSKRVRKTDQIGWYDDTHFGILMPNTNHAGAQAFLNDIRPFQHDCETPIAIETISYPNKDSFI